MIFSSIFLSAEGPSLGLNKKLRRPPTVPEIIDNDGVAPVLGTLSTSLNPLGASYKLQHNPYASHELTYAQTLAKHVKRRANREVRGDQGKGNHAVRARDAHLAISRCRNTQTCTRKASHCKI